MQRQIPSPADSGASCLDLSNWTGVALDALVCIFHLHTFVFELLPTDLFCATYLQTSCCKPRLEHLFATVTCGRYFLGARFSPVALEL